MFGIGTIMSYMHASFRSINKVQGGNVYRIESFMLVILLILVSVLGGCVQEKPRKSALSTTSSSVSTPAVRLERSPAGEALFRQFCFNCHPDGGNVSDPKKSLQGSALRENNITNPENIVKIMRNPQSRMIRFDVGTISDRDARAIAEYVLDSFR